LRNEQNVVYLLPFNYISTGISIKVWYDIIWKLNIAYFSNWWDCTLARLYQRI